MALRKHEHEGAYSRDCHPRLPRRLHVSSHDQFNFMSLDFTDRAGRTKH